MNVFRATSTAALSLALVMLALGTGCGSTELPPLIGEGPEVYELLGAQPPDDPSASALASARRLHQSLTQNDTDMVWALLALPTRRALDERGAVISASGRELIDASTLPSPSGAIRKVRYAALFFGRDIVDLQDSMLTVTTDAGTGDTTHTGRTIYAVSSDGSKSELVFVHEEDGWKLLKTGF
ncbi:MAG: hypothetical protein ACI9MR_001511 [Myxococcota bacterium]|jgi:hypothetical protein